MRIETIGNATLYLGDCLELMQSIHDGSVDMILCDLPYGTTDCKWDTVIPFEPLWAQYRRVAKRNAAIVLTASQPFTTALIASNFKDFRYCWVWEKQQPTGFLDARRKPMKSHEDVCVFYASTATYNPQGLTAVQVKNSRKNKAGSGVYGAVGADDYVQKEGNFPRSVLKIDRVTHGQVHPTQKPVALMEYMIRTYTQEGETVLDNCMGSGTTGVACARLGRHFVGIERERKYFDIACERIENEQRQCRSAV